MDLDHAYLAWDGKQVWLADPGSETGTFVNRRPVRTQRLHPGELVQIGPYAWQFSVLDGLGAYLRPVGRIDGCRLRLHGLSEPGRLEPLDLDVASGEFVAIVGPSGGGKSTLIAATIAANRPGTVYFNDDDAAEHPDEFRELLGYVSQKETLHGDLTVEDALRFSGKLRSTNNIESNVTRLLNEAEIRYRSRDKPCRRLSGGESKRVRVAVELIGHPRLFILDEPGSGLDRDRERTLMRALRTLSFRGCTVIIVTHGLHELGSVDRVLVLADKKARFLGPPEQLCQTGGVNRPDEVDFGDPQQMARLGPGSLSPTAPVERVALRPERSFRERANLFARQTALLVRREAALLAGGWVKRLLVPVVVLPLLFGSALSAVGYGTIDLFLFLTVLASIWMGSSLSLLSIADEWEIVEHERLLFLRPAAYVSAKFCLSAIVACLQTLAFCLILAVFDCWSAPRNYEPNLPGLWPLFLTATAAVGLGLAISALVRGNRPLANFILPLVMLCQIVFSAHIGSRQGETANPETRSIYDDFTIRPGEAANQRPTPLSVVGSYLTLSRYGDELLSLTAAQGRYDAWRIPSGRRAFTALFAATLGLPAVAWLFLRFHLSRQNSRLTERLLAQFRRLFSKAHGF